MSKHVYDLIVEFFRINPKVSNNKLYFKEIQWQFDLAWFLREKSKYKVLLEYTSIKRSNKLDETDIMLLSDDGHFIPIELKYKVLPVGKTNGFDLGKQHAADLGRYNYILDIKRIEKLRDNAISRKDIDERLKFFDCGFAIIISNERGYWENNKQKAINKNYKYRNLCIAEGDKISGLLKKVENNSGIDNIKLNGSYEMHWDTYHKYDYKKNNLFKYLITEVKK